MIKDEFNDRCVIVMRSESTYKEETYPPEEIFYRGRLRNEAIRAYIKEKHNE
jgi:hypothetical protein